MSNTLITDASSVVKMIMKADQKTVRTSSWKKYTKRIDRIIRHDMPSMCLVEKNNTRRVYQSNVGDACFEIEFRFQGDASRSSCTGVYRENGTIKFSCTCDHPKTLYKSIEAFVDDHFYDSPGHPIFR